MKKFAVSSLLCLTLSLSCGIAIEKQDMTQEAVTTENPQKEISKISEAFGHLIGKNIESMGVQFDIQYVIKGLKDAAAGKNSPMTEMECIQAITAAQEFAFKEQSEVNLQKAEEFLHNNGNEKGTVTIAEGKVQYKVEKEGSGGKMESTDTPLIRYVGKFMDGSVFGASKEDEPISLDEIIPGLKAGLMGMKEGEKRVIYIHPDLGYGTRGALPPNSLLTFEIELVKTNAPMHPEQENESLPGSKKPTGEIALPDAAIDHIR